MACCFWIGIKRVNRFRGYVAEIQEQGFMLMDHSFEIGSGVYRVLCGRRIKYDEENRTIPLLRQQREDDSTA